MPVAHRLLFSLTILLAATAQAAVDGQKLYTGRRQPGRRGLRHLPRRRWHGPGRRRLSAPGGPSRRLPEQAAARPQAGRQSRAPGDEGHSRCSRRRRDQALANTLAAMPAPKPVELSRVATRAAPARPWRCVAPGAQHSRVRDLSRSGRQRRGEAFPPLQGQGEMYLSNQLRAWQLGTRRNDPNDLMGHIAKSLSEEEIRSVSQFFATLGQAGGQP